MAAKNSGYFPAPGAQNPGKYPRVGPNYQRFGEQPGWTYSPRDDKYYRDQASRQALEDYEVQQGLRSPPPKEPKQPGLADIVLPVAATGTAIAAGQGLGGMLVDTLGTIGKPSAAAQIAQQAPGAVTQIGGTAPVVGAGQITSTPSGLLGATSAPTTTGATASTGASGAATGGTGTAATNAGAATTGSTLGAIVPPVAAAAGTYLAGRAAMNMIQGKDDKSIQGRLGRVQLGIATGGLSEIANKTGLFGHKSTRQIAQKNTNELLKQAPDDQQHQAYVSGMRAQYQAGPPDPSKPFAGKYSSWDEYKKAGLEAGDLTGVYGNIKTYGPEWSKLTQEQRIAITQANINDGLYNAKKGEVEITNKDKALENKARILGGAAVTPQQPGPAPLPPGTTPQQVAAAPSQGLQSINPGITPPNQTGLLAAVPPGVSNQVQNLRTNTRSPGIDKNGRRIRY